MNEFSLSAGEGKHQVYLKSVLCGKDVSICIYGGEIPHIGAIAVAVPEKSLSGDDKDSASVSVVCIPGHKEDELARHAALILSSKWQCIVTVSVGIHIDNASKEDINKLSTNVEKLVEDSIDKIVRKSK